MCIFISCVQQKKLLDMDRLHFALQQKGYNKQNGDVAILAAYHLVFEWRWETYISRNSTVNIEIFRCLLWKNSSGGAGKEVMRKRQKDGEQMGVVLAIGKEGRRENNMKDIPAENSENSKCDREEHDLQKQHLYVYYFYISTSFLLFGFYSNIFYISLEIRNVQGEDL